MAPPGAEFAEGPTAAPSDDEMSGHLENGVASDLGGAEVSSDMVYGDKTGATKPLVVPMPGDAPPTLEGVHKKPPFMPDSRIYGSPRLGEGGHNQDMPPRSVPIFPDNSNYLNPALVGNIHGCSESNHRQVPQLRVKTRGVGPQMGRVPQAPEVPIGVPADERATLTMPLLGDFKHFTEDSNRGRRPEAPPSTQLLPGRCSATPSDGEHIRGPGNNSESLDYEPIQNTVFLSRLIKDREAEKRHFYGYTGRTFAKFLITIHAGVVIGLLGIAIGSTSKHMIAWKNDIVMSLCDLTSNEGYMAAMFFHIMYSVGLVVLAVALVQFWAPEAAGAGVSLVIAYLNGNHVPNLFHLRTLLTKIIGTMCALSANLFVGPEGPMVHIGAAVASVLTYMECWGCCMLRRVKPAKLYISAEPVKTDSDQCSLYTTNNDLEDVGYFGRKWASLCNFLLELYSDLDRRDFLSAGAGAGIAAAFGAPVGGVLFSMEEAATYWSKKVAWRCFLCAVAGVMTLNWVHPLIGPKCEEGDQSIACDTDKTGMLSFEKGVELENGDWLKQTPYILGISVIAGIIGVIFNSFRIMLWRVRAAPKKHMLRMLEAIGIAMLTVIVMFAASGWLGRCRTILDKSWEEESAYLQFNCEEGKHNDLASAFMAAPEVTIKRMFSLGSPQEDSDRQAAGEEADTFFDSHFTIQSLCSFIPLYLVVMSLGAGIALPGGLFLPAIMVGGATGTLYGRLMHSVAAHFGYHKIQPGFYALLGATGSLASVFRSSISLVVIVIEGTRNIDYLFGVVLAVVTSNWVAHHIHHDGIYESEIERAGNVHFLKPEAPRPLFFQTAEQVMASDVHAFRAIEKVSYVLKVLRETTCNGFPVIDKDERDGRGELRVGRLEGLILRSQLLVMLRRRVFCDRSGNPVMKVDEEQIDAEMRNFYRLQHTHHRFLATTEKMVDALELDWVHNSLSPKLQGEQPAVPILPNSGDTPGHSATTVGSNRFASPFSQSGAPGSLLSGPMYMDLRPYMNRAPLTVRQECCAARAYEVFVSLGLRHLCVVNDRNEVTGIITRKDLDHAAGHGWWRTSRIAPSPEQHNIIYRRLQSRMGSFKLMTRNFSANELTTVHSAEPFIHCDDDSSEEGDGRPRSVI